MEIWHHRMLITTFAASLAQRHSLAGNSLEGALELKLEDGFLMTAKPCNWVHLLLPFFTPYHYPENEKITILSIDIGVVWMESGIAGLWPESVACDAQRSVSFHWRFLPQLMELDILIERSELWHVLITILLQFYSFVHCRNQYSQL